MKRYEDEFLIVDLLLGSCVLAGIFLDKPQVVRFFKNCIKTHRSKKTIIPPNPTPVVSLYGRKESQTK
ncbi:hypothetical protein ES702_00476 [subsurface metagenome]